MAVTCETCDFSYAEEVQEDRAAHQKRHAAIISALRPRPMVRFLRSVGVGGIVGPIENGSARWQHEEVYWRAVMFRKEFDYDFVPWEADGGNETDAQAFLFNDDTGTFGQGAIAGACAFAWRDYSDVPPRWAISWVWIAPSARRKGILTRCWPLFRQRYGEFHLERPISEPMAAFITRIGHPG